MAKCLKTISRNIKKKIKEMGISQAELARRAANGASLPTINEIINGTIKNPHIGQLEAIAEALGITLQNLVTTPEERGHHPMDCLDVCIETLKQRDDIAFVDLKGINEPH
jgi:transcriptional regulator with XRE-family HTH domain